MSKKKGTKPAPRGRTPERSAEATVKPGHPTRRGTSTTPRPAPGKRGGPPKAAEDVTIVPDPSSGAGLKVRKARINQLHRKCAGATRKVVEIAREVGDELIQIKEEVGHGHFKRWIEENCEFSYETGSAYMRVARNWEKVVGSSAGKYAVPASLTIEKALNLFSKTKEESSVDRGAHSRRPDVSGPGGPPPKSGEDGDEPDATGPDDQEEGKSAEPPDAPARERADRHEKAGPAPRGAATPDRSSVGEPHERRAGEGIADDEIAKLEETPGDDQGDEWADLRLPLREQLAVLGNTAVFDADVSLYRKARPLIEQLAALHRPSGQDAEFLDVTYVSVITYTGLVSIMTGVRPPEQWELCDVCDGSAPNRDQPCRKCGRAGFLKTFDLTPVDV